MKTTKKVLSLLLAVLMMATMMLSAFAAPKVVVSGKAGENVTWQLTEDGVLTVSGKGAVEDVIEYEYDEDGEICSQSTTASIDLTLSDYYDEATQGLNAEQAEKFKFSMVKEIIVEEGITEIPDSEISSYYPRKVSLPASLTKLGYDAFNATYAEEVIIRSKTVQFVQFYVAGCPVGAKPYESLDDAIQSHIDLNMKQQKFQDDMIPLYGLREIFGVQNGYDQLNEDYTVEMILEYYNGELGSHATTLDELTPVLLEKINAYYGTSFETIGDIYELKEYDWGLEIEMTETILDLYETEANAFFDNRIDSLPLGSEPESNDMTVYQWLTVFAPNDSTAEKSCKTSHVNFIGLCNFCGQVHGGSFWQSVISAMHKVFYFFAHLFKVM